MDDDTNSRCLCNLFHGGLTDTHCMAWRVFVNPCFEKMAIEFIVNFCAKYSCSVFSEESSGHLEWVTG